MIKATILADRKKVWDYYTLPEHITKWNFASDDWQCPSAINDLRIGGKYIARMEANDGSFGFDFVAKYDEIIDYEKIAYTILDNRKVIIKFESKNNETELHITFEAEHENPIELQREGWQAILNNFKKYTENN